MDESFHYPPELLNLLVDTIPLLCRSKDDVLLFFRGAGVPEADFADLQSKLRTDRASVGKFEIARTVLKRLNEKGDPYLRQRREILKRVTEFEDFSSCWPNDQMKAKGGVAEVRRVVNVKDSFTRMAKEREKEREEKAETARQERARVQLKRSRITAAKGELYSLFALENEPSKRGVALEKVLNDLFAAYGILVTRDFRRQAPDSPKVIEQIDGVIQLDRQLVLVEMKWVKEPVGVDLISQPLVRLFSRADARGLVISTTGFADTAIAQCREFLNQKVITLCHLDEIVALLEREGDLVTLLRGKFLAAELRKEPYVRVGA